VGVSCYDTGPYALDGRDFPNRRGLVFSQWRGRFSGHFIVFGYYHYVIIFAGNGQPPPTSTLYHHQCLFYQVFLGYNMGAGRMEESFGFYEMFTTNTYLVP